MTNRVKAFREEQRMSQAELSRRSGVSLRQVQYIEGGASPRVSTAFAIARALSTPTESISITDLFEEPSEVAS